ncbi:MAG TPA: hypothetical protein VF921_16695, partial [Vicinamibacterales bacterium]
TIALIAGLYDRRFALFAFAISTSFVSRTTRLALWCDVGATRKLMKKEESELMAMVKKTTTSAARPSRGPVDAPGKHHRKPPPQERLDKRMGEPVGKQMGQKNARTGRRGGRG